MIQWTKIDTRDKNKIMTAINFAELKKRREAQKQALESKLQNNNRPQQNDEANFWKPTTDAAGNATAVIRFLPAHQYEEDPYVTIFSHAFQGPKGWYIEHSLSTIGKPDPVGEYNRAQWEDGDKEGPKARKRTTKFISNIYVVADPNNPDAEGKVFKFKYGRKIFDMQKACLVENTDEIEIEDDEKVPTFNPFDLWEGANFTLKVKRNIINNKPVPNYDNSKFGKPKPLFVTSKGEPDDAKMEAVWLQCYPLQEEIDPSKFKTYEQLKTRFDRIMGFTNSAPANRSFADEIAEEDIEQEVAPAKAQKAAAKPKTQKAQEAAPVDTSVDDDDNWFQQFEKQLDDDVPF